MASPNWTSEKTAADMALEDKAKKALGLNDFQYNNCIGSIETTTTADLHFRPGRTTHFTMKNSNNLPVELTPKQFIEAAIACGGKIKYENLGNGKFKITAKVNPDMRAEFHSRLKNADRNAPSNVPSNPAPHKDETPSPAALGR